MVFAPFGDILAQTFFVELIFKLGVAHEIIDDTGKIDHVSVFLDFILDFVRLDRAADRFSRNPKNFGRFRYG